MDAETVALIWIAGAAIWLFFCGYNDLQCTPAPVFGIIWPVALVGIAMYGAVEFPMWAGRRVRALLKGE